MLSSHPPLSPPPSPARSPPHLLPLSHFSKISLPPDLPPTFPPSIALCPCLSLSNSRSVSCLLPILSPQDYATSCFWNGSPPPPPAQTTPPTTGAINELPEGAHTWCGCDSHVPRDSRYLRPPPFPRAPQPWGPYSHSSQTLGRLHGSRSRRNFPPLCRKQMFNILWMNKLPPTDSFPLPPDLLLPYPSVGQEPSCQGPEATSLGNSETQLQKFLLGEGRGDKAGCLYSF